MLAQFDMRVGVCDPRKEGSNDDYEEEADVPADDLDGVGEVEQRVIGR